MDKGASKGKCKPTLQSYSIQHELLYPKVKIFFINFQLIKLHFASYVVVVVVCTYSFNKQ